MGDAVQLETLDDYALLHIFDYLDFIELLHMADLSRRFRSIIGHHYMLGKYRIQHSIFRIADKKPPAITTNAITIGQYEAAAEFLRNFGDLITSFDFSSFYLSDTEIDALSHVIEENCTNSLKQIKLCDAGLKLVAQVKQSFNNVIEVDLSNFAHTYNIELNRIFPNMKTLNVEVQYPIELTSIVQYYPNLTNLQFTEVGYYDEDSILFDVLQLNPQLHSLKVNRFFKAEELQFINKNLQELKTLELSSYPDHLFEPDENEIIHMDNVKHFVLKEEHSTFRSHHQIPITFAHLQSIEIFSMKLSMPLQRLIQQNDKLKMISLPWIETMESFARILDIVGQLNELEEIRLKWQREIGAGNTLRLLNESEQLKRITFIARIGRDYDDLMAIIPSEFEVTTVEVIHKVKHVTIRRIY